MKTKRKIVVDLTMTGSKANVRKMERKILEAVQAAVEEAASGNFTGQGKVKTEWTIMLQ